jgi:hypothetical protein
MSLSIRYSIHWPEYEQSESEPTSTVVLTSPAGRYVDIRKLINLTDQNSENLGFDWYFAGYEIELSSTKIEFNHDFFDSKYIDYFYSHGKSSTGFINSSDIGNFSNSTNEEEINKGIRIETGKMLNPKTNKIENYIEKWISCNPKIDKLQFIGDLKLNCKCIVLDTLNGGISDNESQNNYIGRYILYGNWIQALIWDKNENQKINSIGILRTNINLKEPLISFGKQIEKFPVLENLKDIRLSDTINCNRVLWKVVEFVND